MATTYSLSMTGITHVSPQAVATLQVPDVDATGTNCLRDGTSAVVGSLGEKGTQYVQRLGSQVLCKNPDGSQSWYTIDSTLSRRGALVLLPVGP